MKIIKIKINKPLKSYKRGEIILLEADEDGTPLEFYWRRRMQDSLIDNCIEVVEEKARKK